MRALGRRSASEIRVSGVLSTDGGMVVLKFGEEVDGQS